MSTSLTSRVKLVKPNPGTAELVNVATQINASFDKIDSDIGARPCTSTTRPSAPYDGQIIRETDTRRMFVYNTAQTTWEQIMLPGPSKFGAPVDFERTTTGQSWWNGYITNEANPRLSVLANGGLNWGSGAAPTDTNLYRSGANTLKTDDTFSANGYQINGNQSWVMTYCDEIALASSMNAIGTSFVDITGVTLSFTTRKNNAIVKAYYTIDAQTAISSAGNVAVRVTIAGTEYSADSAVLLNLSNTTAGGQATVGNFKKVVVPTAGSYSAKLRVQSATAGGWNIVAGHTKLMVEVFE